MLKNEELNGRSALNAQPSCTWIPGDTSSEMPKALLGGDRQHKELTLASTDVVSVTTMIAPGDGSTGGVLGL